jgi:integral membrane protein (TIGR01906 family)
MDDVKRVYNALTLAAAIALGLAVVAAVHLVRQGDRCSVWTAVCQGSVATLVLLAVLVVWMVIGFERFFELFHGLFFEDGTWLFLYSDTLIRLFPLRFWQDAGLIVGGGVSLLSVVLLRVGVWRRWATC